MATSLTEIPDTITAGTTVRYTATRSDYPASSGWTAKLYVSGASVTGGQDGVASGAAFIFTLTPAITAPLKPGMYQWSEIYTKAGEQYVGASGTLTVVANIAAAGAGDMLTFEQRALIIVQAAIEGRLTSDMEAFSIAGRAVTKISMPDLMRIRRELRAEVKSQTNPGRFMEEVRFSFPGTSSET